MATKAKSYKAIPHKRASYLDRFKVKFKLRAPSGIKLSQGETEALIELQHEDIQVLKDNKQEVLAAIGVTHSVDVGNQIKKVQSARSVAAATYRQTKDPIKKREWARRLVIADTTRNTLVDMKNRMVSTRERLEMIKGDITLQLFEAEAKVAETEAYAKAGKQLRLAGQTLVNARIRAKSNVIEYSNLEVSMEGAEKLISAETTEELLEQADRISGAKQ